MNTYKVKDGSDQVIPGIGRTQNGMITTEAIIENPNFELIENNNEQLPPQEQPQVQSQESQPEEQAQSAVDPSVPAKQINEPQKENE